MASFDDAMKNAVPGGNPATPIAVAVGALISARCSAAAPRGVHAFCADPPAWATHADKRPGRQHSRRPHGSYW